jgi:hypothetical protein
MKLTKRHARKVLEVVDAGLVHGMGEPEPGKMCVEAAVCYALGLPHGDDPPCVGKAVREFKIRLNDAQWSSDKARAKGMRRVAIAQLGSDEIDQRAFAKIVALETVRQILPIVLRNAARKIPAHKAALLKAAKDCANAAALAAAGDAARDAARDAAWDAAVAAGDAARDAAWDAADAAEAAEAAVAAVAARDAEAAWAAAYAAGDAARAARAVPKKVLPIAAEIAVQALITLKSPGAKWLDLCE